MRFTRGDSGKETFLVEDFEEFEKMDVSEIHARRLNAKEVLKPMKGEKFKFRITYGTVKLSGGISGFWEHPPWSGIAHTEEKN